MLFLVVISLVVLPAAESKWFVLFLFVLFITTLTSFNIKIERNALLRLGVLINVK